jgi:hypothetical protein
MPSTKPLRYHIPALIVLGIICYIFIGKPYVYFNEKMLLLLVSLFAAYRIVRSRHSPVPFNGNTKAVFIILLVFGSIYAMGAAAMYSSFVRARAMLDGTIYTITEDDHFFEEATFTLTRHSLIGSSQDIGTRFFTDGYRGPIFIRRYMGRIYISINERPTIGLTPYHEIGAMKYNK